MVDPERLITPVVSPTLVSSFFCLSTELLGGRRIELARHQPILLNLPKQLGAHVPEVGHVGTSHSIVEEGPTLVLALTSHLLQLGANVDLLDSLQRKRKY